MKDVARKRYTDDDVRTAVAESISYRQALIKLGLAPLGGNYATIKRLISRLELDTSHFLGQGHSRGQTYPERHSSIESILVEGRPYSSFKLKNRLFRSGLKERQCEGCDRTAWGDQEIPLELHHVNGVSDDNRLENLQILCPNCHAITDNYRGKNIRKNDS